MIFAALIALSYGAQAAEPARPLVVRWTSVAGFLLDDGETTLAFDPTFTRPGLLQWLGLKTLKPKFEAIDENLAVLGVKKIDAVFVSHGHFDHAVDAPEIAQRFGARLYGGRSLERISRANAREFGWPKDPFRAVSDRETIQVGKFKIKFFRRDHPAIFPLIGFHFLGGEVPADFSFGTYQYREGEVWCWKIEHPSGKVFADQGSHFFHGVKDELAGVSTFILGVANKVSVENFVNGSVGAFRPKRLIPLHFDFFFTALNREETRLLPGIEWDEIVKASAKASPETKLALPRFGERITLD